MIINNKYLESGLEIFINIIFIRNFYLILYFSKEYYYYIDLFQRFFYRFRY